MARTRFVTALVYRGKVDGGPVQVVSDAKPWSLDQGAERDWKVVDLYSMGAVDGHLYAVVRLEEIKKGGGVVPLNV